MSATARRPARSDVLVAVVVGIVQVGVTYAASRHQPERQPWDVWAVVLLAIGPVALVVRRRYPVAVLFVSSATVLAYWVVGYARGPVFLAMIVALYTVIVAGRRLVAALVLAGGYLGFLWLGPLLGRDDWPTAGAAIGLAAWLLVLFGACELIRTRRERSVESARLHDEEMRRRVSDERVRVARELHDVLAHHISLINVQAATTLHLLDGTGDERATRALTTIKEVSHETLAELRSILGALRQVDEAAPRAPAPSLSRVDDLVSTFRASGVRADVVVDGAPRPLPSAVDLAAYRIVQESLTNVARHADTDAARVRVAYRSSDVVVEVDDDGRGADRVVPGNGIVGMTERTTALGGTLQAGPRAGGGFHVRAWFPLEDGP